MRDSNAIISLFRASAQETRLVYFQVMMTKAADELEAWLIDHPLPRSVPDHPQ